jgi:hypothetical protein
VLEDKNNHTIDALRYALEELRRTGYKPRQQQKGPPRDRWDRAFKGKEESASWKTA